MLNFEILCKKKSCWNLKYILIREPHMSTHLNFFFIIPIISFWQITYFFLLFQLYHFRWILGWGFKQIPHRWTTLNNSWEPLDQSSSQIIFYIACTRFVFLSSLSYSPRLCPTLQRLNFHNLKVPFFLKNELLI